MSAVGDVVVVGPHDLLVQRDFDELGQFRVALSVAGDHHVHARLKRLASFTLIPRLSASSLLLCSLTAVLRKIAQQAILLVESYF